MVDPLRYHSKVDAVRSVVMMAAAWLCALLAGILGALEPRGAGLWASCGLRDLPDGAADEDADGVSLYRRVYAGVFAVVVFVIPFAALCWIYVSIYGAAHRNSQRTRRNGSGEARASRESSLASAPAPGALADGTRMITRRPAASQTSRVSLRCRR